MLHNDTRLQNAILDTTVSAFYEGNTDADWLGYDGEPNPLLLGNRKAVATPFLRDFSPALEGMLYSVLPHTANILNTSYDIDQLVSEIFT
jgi:hypothetical protein